MIINDKSQAHFQSFIPLIKSKEVLLSLNATCSQLFENQYGAIYSCNVKTVMPVLFN